MGRRKKMPSIVKEMCEAHGPLLLDSGVLILVYFLTCISLAK